MEDDRGAAGAGREREDQMDKGSVPAARRGARRGVVAVGLAVAGVMGMPAWGAVGRAVAALMGIAACGGGDDGGGGGGGSASNKPTTLKVGVIPIADVAPLYVGIKQGFFKQENLTIQPQLAEGGATITAQTVSGDLQIGF